MMSGGETIVGNGSGTTISTFTLPITSNNPFALSSSEARAEEDYVFKVPEVPKGPAKRRNQKQEAGPAENMAGNRPGYYVGHVSGSVLGRASGSSGSSRRYRAGRRRRGPNAPGTARSRQNGPGVYPRGHRHHVLDLYAQSPPSAAGKERSRAGQANRPPPTYSAGTGMASHSYVRAPNVVVPPANGASIPGYYYVRTPGPDGTGESGYYVRMPSWAGSASNAPEPPSAQGSSTSTYGSGTGMDDYCTEASAPAPIDPPPYPMAMAGYGSMSVQTETGAIQGPSSGRPHLLSGNAPDFSLSGSNGYQDVPNLSGTSYLGTDVSELSFQMPSLPSGPYGNGSSGNSYLGLGNNFNLGNMTTSTGRAEGSASSGREPDPAPDPNGRRTLEPPTAEDQVVFRGYEYKTPPTKLLLVPCRTTEPADLIDAMQLGIPVPLGTVVRRIIQPTISYEINHNGVSEDKFYAHRRYKRNHRLMSLVASNEIVPNQQTVVTNSKLKALEKQVKALEYYLNREVTETGAICRRHELKLKIIEESRARFAATYRNISYRVDSQYIKRLSDAILKCFKKNSEEKRMEEEKNKEAEAVAAEVAAALLLSLTDPASNPAVSEGLPDNEAENTTGLAELSTVDLNDFLRDGIPEEMVGLALQGLEEDVDEDLLLGDDLPDDPEAILFAELSDEEEAEPIVPEEQEPEEEDPVEVIDLISDTSEEEGDAVMIINYADEGQGRGVPMSYGAQGQDEFMPMDYAVEGQEEFMGMNYVAQGEDNVMPIHYAAQAQEVIEENRAQNVNAITLE